MGAEWRANFWMAVELLIVSVVLFVIADKVYTAVATVNEPLGFNADHVYSIQLRELTSTAPGYKERSPRESTTDINTILDRLRARPEIETVSRSHNASPYNPNNSARQFDVDTFSMHDRSVLVRNVDRHFFKVFRIQGANGESPEQLGEILEQYKIIPSDNMMRDRAGVESMKSFYGKTIISNEDTLTIPTSFVPMRYSDYLTAYGWQGVSVFTHEPQWMHTYSEVTVRVKDNMDRDFADNLMKSADKDLMAGNIYIAGVQSFEWLKERHNRERAADTRNTIICGVFLLINIFFGIFGTFWFRSQQRTREIALRMANGASRLDIFRRILGEGQLLLLIITPIAAAIDWTLTHYEFTTWYDGYFQWARFLTSAVAAWILLAFMIAAGTALPAMRAMRISPANALKSE